MIELIVKTSRQRNDYGVNLIRHVLYREIVFAKESGPTSHNLRVMRRLQRSNKLRMIDIDQKESDIKKNAEPD